MAFGEADCTGIGVVDIGPIRAIPLEVLRKGAIHGGLSRGGKCRTPVEVRHAQADVRSYVAVALVVIGKRPDCLAGGLGLLGFHQCLGGVDAGDDHVIAGVEEIVGNLGWVGGDARDVEPETDPGDREGQRWWHLCPAPWSSSTWRPGKLRQPGGGFHR